jgi:hypothetical protein
MKGFALLLLLGPLALAAPSLLVVAVERVGLPPYDGTGRIYRLEGPECQTLRVGEILALRRQGERRSLGQLEILSVFPDHAGARLVLAGDTFPLKGDMAVRAEPIPALPEVPAVAPPPLATTDSLRPMILARAFPVFLEPPVVHREPIYFVKEDATLSPGAQAKLRLWVETWGRAGQWSLECPQADSPQSTQRLSALRSQLQQLGIPSLDIKMLPREPSAQYDAIYVKKQP